MLSPRSNSAKEMGYGLNGAYDAQAPSLYPGMLKEGALGIALDYDVSWSFEAMRKCDKLITDDLDQLLSTKQLGLHLSDMPDDIAAAQVIYDRAIRHGIGLRLPI
jgi:hypothetical protein